MPGKKYCARVQRCATLCDACGAYMGACCSCEIVDELAVRRSTSTPATPKCTLECTLECTPECGAVVGGADPPATSPTVEASAHSAVQGVQQPRPEVGSGRKRANQGALSRARASRTRRPSPHALAAPRQAPVEALVATLRELPHGVERV